jgi:hypothetical protein
MASPPMNFRLILQTLADHQVDFIVIGGVCAVLHGAPVTTFDVDLVHARTPENIERLLRALESLDTIYRGQFGVLPPFWCSCAVQRFID